MAKVKIFSASALRNEMIQQSGWDFTFRHKYTGDNVGIIHAFTWGPKDLQSPFAYPQWQVRSKWTRNQQTAFEQKLQAEKVRITQLCPVFIRTWFQAHHPELTTNIEVKDTLIIIEAVNSQKFGLAATTPVAPPPDDQQQLVDLIKLI